MAALLMVNACGAGLSIGALCFAINGADRGTCISVAVCGAFVSLGSIAALGIFTDRQSA